MGKVLDLEPSLFRKRGLRNPTKGDDGKRDTFFDWENYSKIWLYVSRNDTRRRYYRLVEIGLRAKK